MACYTMPYIPTLYSSPRHQFPLELEEVGVLDLEHEDGLLVGLEIRHLIGV